MLDIREIENFIEEQETNAKQIEKISEQVETINKDIKDMESELETSQNAIEILRTVSDKTVKGSYEFLEHTINDALGRIFVDEKRQIKIVESSIQGQYPQIDLDIETSNGVHSISRDGHGIAQVISLLSSLCLIVLTGSRRFMALDEVLSGLSNEALEVIDNILHDFVNIGFNFIINEHGVLFKGAKVYEIEMQNGKSFISNEYIEPNGVYRNKENES